MKTIERIDKKAPVLPRKKRVAAYARVSMESERMQHSLSAQVSYYSALIQKNPEWEYAGVYADYGISGTGMKDRDEFKRMLADCEAGAIDIILTKSIQRFARNTVDLLNTIRRLKELGIEVRFEKENIHSLSGDGELMLTILASFAQEESRSISENCKWGIRKRYERGETGGCKIYGYRTKDGNLVIHEEEAVVVRRIFQMFLNGDSCYSIAQKLNAEGVPSYHRKKFSGEVIGVMIRQEKYTGCTLAQKFYAEDHITHKLTKNKGELPMFFIEETHPAIISIEMFQAAQREFADALLQKSYTTDFLTKKTKKNEGEIPQYYVKGNHEAIIDEKTFALVQTKMAARTKGQNRISSVSIFSSKVKCGNCGSWYGSKVWHSTDKYRRVIWQCNHKFDGEKCTTPTLTEDEIKRLFLQAANIAITEREELISVFESYMAPKLAIDALERELAEVETELNVVSGLIDNCIHENARIALNQTAYQEQIAVLEARLNQAEAKKADVIAEITRRQARRQEIDQHFQYLRKLDLLTEFRDDDWLAMVDYMTVHRKDEVWVTFKDGSKIKAGL